jgi:hypothetical protein
VDAVSVEVASAAVVVLSRPRVGVAGDDLGVPQRDAGVQGLVIDACRSECGLMYLAMPAHFAIRRTIR